jgi:hypothetical protein
MARETEGRNDRHDGIHDGNKALPPQGFLIQKCARILNLTKRPEKESLIEQTKERGWSPVGHNREFAQSVAICTMRDMTVEWMTVELDGPGKPEGTLSRRFASSAQMETGAEARKNEILKRRARKSKRFAQQSRREARNVICHNNYISKVPIHGRSQ